MSSCTACGHQLGAGRFCPNCGTPVGSSTPPGAPDLVPHSVEDTAERAVPIPPEAPASAPATAPTRALGPRTPPSAVAPPAPPRYPLYADEVDDWRPYGPLVSTQAPPLTPVEPVEAQPAPTQVSVPVPEPTPEPVREPIGAGRWVEEDQPAAEPAYETYEEWADDEDPRRSPVLWVLAAVVVLGVVVTGWWHLARDTGSEQTTATDSPSASASPADVADKATAQAPRSAPPNEDVNGQRVTYDAAHMLDGDPETAWRVAGSGAGMTLTFTLPQATEVTSVGLINGYAKTSTDAQGRSFDWYAGNRRVKAVVWGFDDGTKVRQQLKDKDRDVQSIDVGPVTTKKVTLKIVRVTNPGTGTSARNFTAISEVSLVGSPGK